MNFYLIISDEMKFEKQNDYFRFQTSVVLRIVWREVSVIIGGNEVLHHLLTNFTSFCKDFPWDSSWNKRAT